MINSKSYKSFRDPSGFVYKKDKNFLRVIHKPYVNFYKQLFKEEWYRKLVTQKKIQNGLWKKNNKNSYQIVHKAFSFPLFPHELCSQQLYDSGLLTLEIAEKALENGYILKDASAWNVLFDGTRPTFIDVTSFENYKGEKLWYAYGQFCRHFIIPLIINCYTKIPIADFFILKRDGVSPAEAKKILGLRSFLSIAAIETILLPSLFSNVKPKKLSSKKRDFELNRYILSETLSRLKQYIQKFNPINYISRTTWSSYEIERNHYFLVDLKSKAKFVRNCLKKCRGEILDLGCNQGEYSLIASSFGLKILSVDYDEAALNKLYLKASKNISVLRTSISNPTPALGWNNKEHSSFIKKTYNKFELVLCLGLIHHLLISERIPLSMILNLLYNFSNKYVLIEWIGLSDKKFVELARENISLYSNLTFDFFLEDAGKFFEIVSVEPLRKTDRTLVLLKKLAHISEAHHKYHVE